MEDDGVGKQAARSRPGLRRQSAPASTSPSSTARVCCLLKTLDEREVDPDQGDAERTRASHEPGAATTAAHDQPRVLTSGERAKAWADVTKAGRP